MILTLAALLSLAQHCAPRVAPATLLAVARAESGFDPYVVAVNSRPRRVLRAQDPAAAAAFAAQAIAGGDSVDIGLGQVNSRTLARLGLGLEAALDPCRNLAISARLLESGYRAARAAVADPQAALGAALSRYNTGDPVRGLRNGYVARVTAAAVDLAAAPPITPPSPATTPQSAPSADVFAARSTPWSSDPSATRRFP